MGTDTGSPTMWSCAARGGYAEHKTGRMDPRRTGALRPSRTASSTGARAAHCALAPSNAVSAAESAVDSCGQQYARSQSAGTIGYMQLNHQFRQLQDDAA